MVLNLEDKSLIEELYLNGMEIKEISKRLDKNYDVVRKFIQRNLKHLKEKHESEKLRDIGELYLKGLGVEEISKRLNKSPDAVKKIIQRNFKHLKEKHKNEKLRAKEILKVTKWESSKAISSRSFAKSNQSIYKQAKNGDLVVNKEVAPVITFDTPKRITKVI